jgi:hypothetical protein
MSHGTSIAEAFAPQAKVLIIDFVGARMVTLALSHPTFELRWVR